jgi:hypothetical protein
MEFEHTLYILLDYKRGLIYAVSTTHFRLFVEERLFWYNVLIYNRANEA